MSNLQPVIAHPFHGGLNQQWLIHEDGHGKVALMSGYGPLYATPTSTNGTVPSLLQFDSTTRFVTSNVPFWFYIFEDGLGYKIIILNTSFGIELAGEDVKLTRRSDASRLFISQNTSSNQDLILGGRLTMLAELSTQSLGFENKFNLAPGIDVTINNLTVWGNTASNNLSGSAKTIVINLNSSPVKVYLSLPESSSYSWKVSNSSETEQNIVRVNRLNRRKLVISPDIPVPTVIPGRADVVGFGTTGVTVVRNPNAENRRLVDVVSSFGFDALAGGWKKDKHVRLVADTTGNGLGDIVGFGDQGVYVSLNNGDDTFQGPKMILSDFSFAAGWRVEKHLRFMADLKNTGRADIIGLGDGGVYVSWNKGDGTFSPAGLIDSAFSYDALGWRLERHPRFLADLTGNGVPDIVGFGDSGVTATFNNGDGTFQAGQMVLEGFCYNSGWLVDKHPRFVADLTGDGKADLLGFSDDGVYIALNNGDGTFQPIKKVSSDFSLNEGGWLVEKHPRFVADLTGNGCGDIIGFGDGGVYVGINNGDGTFQKMKLAVAGFCCNLGWRVRENPRFLADLTGDGRADIVGFGNEKVFVSYNDGNGNFKPMTELVDGFGCDRGWAVGETVRYVANLFI